MTMKEYVEGLVEFLKDNPETADFIVVTSKDDEGNGYNLVYQTPTIGYYDADERDFSMIIDDENDDDSEFESYDSDECHSVPNAYQSVPNAICVN